ncbi:hypothetical protein QFZ60_001684 [Arthrobacter sp. B2I5]|nr:hypothetical protein [Arthrobacter sp. B2I5]
MDNDQELAVNEDAAAAGAAAPKRAVRTRRKAAPKTDDAVTDAVATAPEPAVPEASGDLPVEEAAKAPGAPHTCPQEAGHRRTPARLR